VEETPTESCFFLRRPAWAENAPAFAEALAIKPYVNYFLFSIFPAKQHIVFRAVGGRNTNRGVRITAADCFNVQPHYWQYQC